jgi:hypothetical protein
VFNVCIAVVIGMGTFSSVIARMVIGVAGISVVIGVAGSCVITAVVASVPSVRICNHSLCFSYSGRCIQKANR